MRAMLCRDWGEPESLTLGDLADPPPPGPGEARIAIAAAGVNFADLLMVAGRYQERPARPFAPGLEAAGTVESVGPGVADFAPGDRVLALLDHGGFAARATVPIGDLFHLPPTMDLATAAGFAITYGTAHGALRWRVDLQPGETLLVLGAGGGVGLAAIEVGKALGATVIAAAGSAEKLALAGRHGADHLIDYKNEDLRARLKAICPAGVAALFDPVGGDAFATAMRAMAWGGRLAVIGFASGTVPQIPANVLLVRNLTVHGLYWGSYRKHRPALLPAAFAELFAWHAAGRLKPPVAAARPLSEAAAALAALRDRRAAGKLVLSLGE
jgi:NADPH2:quinone reductase